MNGLRRGARISISEENCNCLCQPQKGQARNFDYPSSMHMERQRKKWSASKIQCGYLCSAINWSARIVRVEWAAERRLTDEKDGEHGSDQDQRDKSDDMTLSYQSNLEQSLNMSASYRRSSRQAYSPHMLHRFIGVALVLILCSATSAWSSLIIGDSAIEIQELPDDQNQQRQAPQLPSSSQHNHGESQQHSPTNFQSTAGHMLQIEQPNEQVDQIQHQPHLQQMSINNQDKPIDQALEANIRESQPNRLPSGPLPPITKQLDDTTDGDNRSRGNHDYDIQDLNPTRSDERRALSEILAGPSLKGSSGPEDGPDDGKQIAGKIVDFELTPAGGHNKAKIKKKKKKKVHEEKAEAFKKWGKKHKAEKKAMEKKEKEHMKKKKEEGKKKKKKWGLHVQGLKKKGNFKKKKWGKKVKKGKGVKKGKKGKKFLKDKGHKNTGFKTVYHKEEWGKSAKWHDIKREKKWDEKSKKWKKKWKKEKGKKYKGDHMKKFEKQKKEGKKYKKAKKEQHKKFKKEKYEAGKKKKMEEHKKKKEGGEKKMMKEEKKKKKKKKP